MGYQLELFEYVPQEQTISLLGESWAKILGKHFESSSVKNLKAFVKEERKEFIIYPEPRDTLRMFTDLPPEKIRVVFVGQDPYNNGHANGRAFASKLNYPPVTLKYLLSASKTKSKDYTLQNWVDQGVFLMNSVLTVRKGFPSSHYEKGWETFTKNAIKLLCSHTTDRRLMFCFIGQKAKGFAQYVSTPHMVKLAEHPAFAAREERKWENEQLFQQINVAFKLIDQPEIIW